MFDDGGHGDARAGDGVYSCQLPPFAAGAQVRYYVEARAIGSLGTTAFRPANTEWGAIELRVGGAEVAGSSVVINELMARNRRSAPDPQGEYDDWVELYNRGTTAVQLSGMYLSDDPRRPRKWAFPEGVSLSPGGYLLVWADEDPGRSTGLHAAFKLSGQGETLLLVDRDETGNRVLDRVDFGEQPAEVSLGRVPDGSGEFQSLYPSPGTANHR